MEYRYRHLPTSVRRKLMTRISRCRMSASLKSQTAGRLHPPANALNTAWFTITLTMQITKVIDAVMFTQ